ncbi:MAG TPA: tripartite tricarboxylate transporter substrate binding protein [Burkholderiales bacterium]|nr:tripartite tricarboxylate transporter substrate binding protein [Burkholderiales bacterium]
MRIRVRSLLLCMACCAIPAYAQTSAPYPAKPVRLILGPGPGSVADGLTRVVAAGLSELWGQQVVVDNRPGAGNTIAPTIIVKLPPDGYALHRCGVSDAIAPALYKKLPFDHLRDFSQLARIGLTPNILVVHPSLPAKNLKEFIALARAQPGKLDYGTTGVGSSPQLSFELFKHMTKTDITFIPYKTAALAQQDLLAGRIAAQMTNLPNHVETVKNGKVRALGVTTVKRSAKLPDVPTIAEGGLPGYDVSSWYGMCAPAAVDRAIQHKIETDVLKLLATSDLKQRLTDLGVDVEPQNSAEFGAFFRAETAKWVKTAREAGIVPQ